MENRCRTVRTNLPLTLGVTLKRTLLTAYNQRSSVDGVAFAMAGK